MDKIIGRCVFWPDRRVPSAKHQDLLHAIAVHVAKPIVNFEYDYRVWILLTPFYLIIFHWYPPPEGLVSRLTTAFDVCYVKHCRLLPLPGYNVAVLNEGVDNMVHHVNKTGRSFKGISY